MTAFIDWQPSAELFQIGSYSIRWYALMWATGLISGYFIVRHLYQQQRIPQEKFDPLFLYCFFGILIGARLGHCIFYEPERFLTSTQGIVEMLLPVRIQPDGSWAFHGYAGLASHGGAIGAFIAMLIYSRQCGVKFLTVLDNVCIATPLTAACIRIGNLMNSEIVGKQTDVPWAFIFHTRDAMVDGQLVPRHPAQLYEALAYIAIFIITIIIYNANRKKPEPSAITAGSGFYFGLCLALIFLFRFFIEFLKKEQVDFERNMTFDMGQLLSLPFIIVGIYFTLRPLIKSRQHE